MSHLPTALVTPLTNRLTPPARQWLDQTLARLAASDRPGDDLALVSAMARRKLGEAPLGETPPLDTPAGPLHIHAWSTATAGRLALVLTARAHHPDLDAPALVLHLGDEAEKIAVIRGLALLDPDGRLGDLAREAGRTNSLDLFAALALDNPWPAAFYDDHDFNQMVLKAFFMELPVARVQGLEARLNRDLIRMARDYREERRAAGRSLPPGLDPLADTDL